MNDIVNVEMAGAWDGDEGVDWTRDYKQHDDAIHGYHIRLLEAAAVAPGERALDIGCGNGQTTRAAARASGDGIALGVDLSTGMLARARELAVAEGITNVQFEHADAQVERFEPNRFDVALSRFGAMFFGDRPAAFANIGGALRPGGRLTLVAWRAFDENEWIQAVRAALALGRDLPVPMPGTPGPFGLADHAAVIDVLRTAGFVDVDIQPVDEPFRAGSDPDDAFAFLGASGVVRGLLEGLSSDERQRGLAALRETIAAHATDDGVLFGSAAALLSARRPAI